MQIFITGVSSGIGKALVKVLISQGHEIWGVARREELLEKLHAELNSPLFRYDKCDLTDADEVKKLHHKMQQTGYLPDAVILNAALDLEDEYPKLSIRSAAAMMRTNVEGAFVWVSAFIEPFLERGSGQFIAIASLFSHWPDRSCVAYSASKAALSMLFRGLRIRYSKSIRFKLVYLGSVDTQINPRFKAKPTDKKSYIIASPGETAQYISKAMLSNKQNFYFPLYISVVFHLLKWLPDSIFEWLTARFRR